ncbi:MAG: hypothetical protein R3B84_20075 [Zavarzinella sp.]
MKSFCYKLALMLVLATVGCVPLKPQKSKAPVIKPEEPAPATVTTPAAPPLPASVSLVQPDDISAANYQIQLNMLEDEIRQDAATLQKN